MRRKKYHPVDVYPICPNCGVDICVPKEAMPDLMWPCIDCKFEQTAEEWRKEETETI